MLLPAQQGSFSFIHYTSEHGLSNDHVTAVLKDRKGFLWVSTVHGLNRFDGRNFRRFFYKNGQEDNPNLNYIQHMTLAPDGSIWVSSANGICRLDPEQLVLEPVFLPENADSVENDRVGKVVFDEKNKAWVSAESGIYCLDPVTKKQLGFWKTPPNIGNFFTCLDKNQQLWLVHESIVHRFDLQTKKLSRYDSLSSGIPMNEVAVMRMAEDKDGQLWITSWFYGLLRYDAACDQIVDYPDRESLATGILPDTTVTGQPFFWLGGGDHGLYLYFPKEDRIRQFKPDLRDPYSHNNYLTYSFFKDEKTGEVWIGTEAGLELYAPLSIRFGRATMPSEDDARQFSLVSSVVKDRTDPTGHTYFISLWARGLHKWNRLSNTFKKLSHQECPLLNEGIFCMHQDRKGYIWIGTHYGISRYHPVSGELKIWDDFFIPTQRRSNNILCLAEGVRGEIWFGSNASGLFRYAPETDRIEPVKLPDSLFAGPDRKYISSIATDPSGLVWMNTNLGTVRFDPASQAVKIIQAKAGANNSAWAGILVSKSGLVYAVYHGGFMEISKDGQLLRRFSQTNGQLMGQPNFLVEDQQKKIWLNSNHFLHCFDPKNGTFSYYGIADGLFSNAPTDGLSITPDGEIFIGFQNAFNYFNPAILRKNTTPPPVAITSIKVMNKERQPVFTTIKPSFFFRKTYQDALLVLRPGETLFSIEFAALNFNQPEKNRYAYQLEGFDESWNYSDRPVATYTNLDGGDYVLRIKAANNDGIWNEAGATMRIRVVPPLVKRWYFKLFLAALVGGLLVGVWVYRRSQRQRLEAFREGLARDLHDEMGSTLSSIRFFSEFARQQMGGSNGQVAGVLQRISDSASTLSETMQDIVWAMKTKNDALEDIASRMTEFGLRLLEARNIHFKVSVLDGFSGKKLTPEQRRNCYLIFKEAVNNAAKYAEATEVELFLAFKKGLLLMKVSDNGKGFSPENLCESGIGGNGLQNMRQRAEEIGGRLDIVSAAGAGTSVELRLKV